MQKTIIEGLLIEVLLYLSIGSVLQIFYFLLLIPGNGSSCNKDKMFIATDSTATSDTPGYLYDRGLPRLYGELQRLLPLHSGRVQTTTLCRLSALEQ